MRRSRTQWFAAGAGAIALAMAGAALGGGRRCRRWRAATWGGARTRRCTCCCRRRSSTSTSPTIDVRFDKGTQGRFAQIATGKAYSPDLGHQLALAAIDARHAVVVMEFKRDIPLNRWIGVVKDNLEAGAQGGPDHARRREAVGDSLAGLVRRAQGPRLREGRPADLRGHARSVRSVVVSKGGQVFVDRVDPGHDGPAGRAGQLLRDRQRVPRAAAQVDVRVSALSHAAPVRHRGRRPPEARHRRRRGGHAGARLLHQPAARAAGRRPADPARASAGDGRQAHREAVRRQVHDRDRLLFGVGHDLHARHAGQGQARDRGAGEDPGRQAGQRAVADVAADQGRPQHRRRAGDHAAGAQGARRTTPRSRRSASASRRTLPDQPVRQRRRPVDGGAGRLR